ARLFRIDCLVAISVNDFALHVHHVVEVERAFSDQVIALLHAFLCRLDRFIQPAMLELLAFLKTKALHDSRHPIGRAEVAHKIVFKTYIKSRTAKVALARAAPPQLSVDAARLVTLGADDVKTATVWNTRSKFNVRSAPRHVCGNRNRARLAGAR